MSPLNPLNDAELSDYRSFLKERTRRFDDEMARIRRGYGSLVAYADLHERLGLRRAVDPLGNPCWRMVEYMPQALRVWLTTNRLGFERRPEWELVNVGQGLWRVYLPEDALAHGDYYELHVEGSGEPGVVRRVPAFARWVEQHRDNPDLWCARVWDPETPYKFRYKRPKRSKFPRIYEAHIGMSQDARNHTPGSVGSYDDFIRDMLPRIKNCGYTSVQLMGVPEHPLYKSFGYQVSSYFAPSSRYGEPDGFRRLVDQAHRLGWPSFSTSRTPTPAPTPSRASRATTPARIFSMSVPISGARRPSITTRT